MSHINNTKQITINNFCRDWVRALLLLEEWTQSQLAQYNKFIESKFKNQVLVRITTTRHGYKRIEQQGNGLKYKIMSQGIPSEELSVLILSSVLGCKGFPKSCKLLSFPPLSRRIFLIIYPFSVDLGLPFVGHAG